MKTEKKAWSEIGENKMKRYLKDRNVVAGLFFLIFDLFYLGFGLQIPVSDTSSVGAGFMPRVYGFCMLVIALILLFTSVKKVKAEDKAGKEVTNDFSMDKRDATRVGCSFVLILLYVILLKELGFLICSVQLLYGLVYLLSPAYVKESFIQKHCMDENGNKKEGCFDSNGKVKFTSMLPYYGKILFFAVIYTVVIYVLFAKGLGLKMPAGILKGVLPF